MKKLEEGTGKKRLDYMQELKDLRRDLVTKRNNLKAKTKIVSKSAYDRYVSDRRAIDEAIERIDLKIRILRQIREELKYF